MSKIKKMLKKIYFESGALEHTLARLGLGTKLVKSFGDKKIKIGMAILAYERPEYLEISLDSLFKTNLHDYDITFLIQDDGSKDPRVREIIEKERDPKFKIVRYYTPKGPFNAGAAINKAMKKLLSLDTFDIVGWADPDCLFHPDWLDKTMKVCLWAKANHKDHILGPFTSFNSSDFEYHKILGVYNSPFGNYVVKKQAGMLNYFYFRDDFEKLGYFQENPDDETLMTVDFDKKRVRNFCTEISYVEHIGQLSILNQWRPIPASAHALLPEQSDWGVDLSKFRQKELEFYLDLERKYIRTAFISSMLTRRSLLEHLVDVVKKTWNKVKHNFEEKRAYKKRRIGWEKNLKLLNSLKGVEVKLKNLPGKRSELKLDIVIPLIPRDVVTADLNILSIKSNLMHPVGKIYLVGPDSEDIKALAVKHDAVFIDENKVLPIGIKDIDYKTNNGQTSMNRAGWLFQQLLKFGMHKHVESDHYYILDADSILTRPQKFEDNGKYLFNVADEYHVPYFEVFEKLTGIRIESPFSFTCHQMLCPVKYIKEFLDYIENYNGQSWYDAMISKADRSNHSGISDYDNFGQYMFAKHRDIIYIEYFYNIGISRNLMHEFTNLSKKYRNKYKTISFQYYL